MADPCLTLRDLTLGYKSHPAVHHLDGTVDKGSLTAIVGANGSGKSTLLKGIAGALAPMAGTLHVADGTRIAYLPQLSELDRTFPARVVDLVGLGLWPKRGLFGRPDRTDRDRVAAAIAAVGLEGFDQRALDTLSGGQMQRALFARAIVQNADLILLDEPFNAVDGRTTSELVGLIKAWHAQGRTVLLVAHDLTLVRRHFPLTMLLARRLVAWGPTADVLTRENLMRAQQFHEAWDDDAPWCEPEETHGHGHDHAGHSHHSHEHLHKGAA